MREILKNLKKENSKSLYKIGAMGKNVKFTQLKILQVCKNFICFRDERFQHFSKFKLNVEVHLKRLAHLTIKSKKKSCFYLFFHY